jgi:acetyl esterase/lipase
MGCMIGKARPGFVARDLVLAVVAASGLIAGSCDNKRTSTSGMGLSTVASQPKPVSLVEARKGFVTKTRGNRQPPGPADAPPPAIFSVVRYSSPVGPLAAYLSPSPHDGKRHPAIVWVVGGFDNSIGDSWSPSDPNNDQSARAFREAGIVLMLPSLRGGNDNPGKRESFYGEVDDVIAAGEYVRKLDYVDPDRVYLGGHSTGGTIAVLVAESTRRFRNIFAFGPLAEVSGYGAEDLVFDPTDAREARLRSPMYFTASIETPTWIVEGAMPPSNKDSLPYLRSDAPPALHVFMVPNVNHFSILAPVTTLLARKIVADTGPTTAIALTNEELVRAVKGQP